MKDEQEIDDLCRQAGCSEKKAKIHAAQIKRKWHPHPPVEFESWWRQQMEYEQGIDAVRAYNCAIYRTRFLEAKEVGVT